MTQLGMKVPLCKLVQVGKHQKKLEIEIFADVCKEDRALIKMGGPLSGSMVRYYTIYSS